MTKNRYMRRASVLMQQHDKDFIIKIVRKHGTIVDGYYIMPLMDLIEYFYLNKNHDYCNLSGIMTLCAQLEKEGRMKVTFQERVKTNI